MGSESQSYDVTIQTIRTIDTIDEPPKLPEGFPQYREIPRTISFNKNGPDASDIVLNLNGNVFPGAKPGDTFTVVITQNNEGS